MQYVKTEGECFFVGFRKHRETDETRLLPEIKHLHFNEMFIWKQCNYIPEKNMSLNNFLLFHLIRHVKNSGFALYNGFQTARER